jgi:alpha-1,6-mannosyltransferase
VRLVTGAGLTVCDVSPFYCETGGGIRTYHRARLDWFARQDRHQYVLVYPGPRSQVTRVGPSITIVRVFGLRLTADPLGYRFSLGYRFVRDAIRDLRPDVLETGDPWLSGPIGLLLRHRGVFDGVLASFCHIDTMSTYIEPFFAKLALPARVSRRLGHIADRLLTAAPRRFDITFVASETMRRRLLARGLPNVVKAPFGVDAALFDICRACPRRDGTRILYAGRLDRDKDIALLKDAAPGLLQRPDVRLTVVGKGREARFFSSIAHPRFRFVSFVRDPQELYRLYAEHDILIAPGRFETFGLTALEGMAAGLVVVGPDAGGTGELLRQAGSPFVFEAGDGAGMREAIVAAVESELRPHATRARDLARSAYGTWADAVARQVAIYEEFSHSKRSNPANRS